jgi:hypothetical protein
MPSSQPLLGARQHLGRTVQEMEDLRPRPLLVLGRVTSGVLLLASKMRARFLAK